jgi:phosphoglycolate phosphatase-like HAD superfamily hydrolase
LQRASVEHGRALREAAGAVHGVDVMNVDAVKYAGRTDAAITRDLLRAVGIEPGAIDTRWEEVKTAAAEAYARLCPADLSATVAPGMVELLDELSSRTAEFRLSLVTGNLEPIARLKLGRAGVGRYFEALRGGFGSDDEDRGRLPAIARARASDPPWERSRTVVIGDTPNDISCARVDEVRVAAVATGPFAVMELADADAVVDDARALLPVLSDWV